MDVVDDDEILYRGVRTDHGYYEPQEDGRVLITSSAFLDEKYQPSVDRAHLCKHDASDTQKAPSDGVTSLIARSVRAIQTVGYDVDVMPDAIKNHLTLPDNPAHAKIFAITPSTLSKSQNKQTFRKLRTALAHLANERGWVIMPGDMR